MRSLGSPHRTEEKDLWSTSKQGAVYWQRLVCLFRGHGHDSGSKVTFTKACVPGKRTFRHRNVSVLSHQARTQERTCVLRTIGRAQRVGRKSGLAHPLPSYRTADRGCNFSTSIFKMGIIMTITKNVLSTYMDQALHESHRGWEVERGLLVPAPHSLSLPLPRLWAPPWLDRRRQDVAPMRRIHLLG